MRKACERITITEKEAGLISVKRTNIRVSSKQKVKVPDNHVLVVYDITQTPKVYKSGICSIVKSERKLFGEKEVEEVLNLVFVSTKEIQLDWGTFNRFDLVCEKTNQAYNLGASGRVSIEIKDPIKFVQAFGSHHEFIGYDRLKELLLDDIVDCFKRQMSYDSKKLPKGLVSASSNLKMITKDTKEHLVNIFNEYGIYVNDVTINNFDCRLKEQYELNMAKEIESQKKLQENRRKLNCPRCGTSLFLNSKFCPECGAEI